MLKKIIIPFKRTNQFTFSVHDLFIKVVVKAYCIYIFVSDSDDFDMEVDHNELL